MNRMSIKLSELGRHEAYLRLYGILTSLPIAKDKADEYLRLERKLAAELIRLWRESYEKAVADLFKSLPATISKDAVDIITSGLSSALGPAFRSSPKVRQNVQKYIRQTYEKAKSEFKADAHFTLPDSRAVEVLAKHNCYWLGEHYGSHIGPRIAELTSTAIEDGLGRKELAAELETALGGEVGGYKYWDVVSSAALVRSRSFGCVAGMEEAGIVEYEILAMQDERMCPICDNMHGRVFSVTKAREKINSVLAIEDPEEFKAAMPWQTVPPNDMSNQDLESAGMSLPPFHGRCRCTMVSTEHYSPTVEYNFPDLDVKNIISYDAVSKRMVTDAHKIPIIGLPNWKYDKLGANGNVIERRFFDDKGNAKLDLDFSDHGSSKAHPMGPHAHDFVGKRRGIPRKMTEEEIKIMIEVLGLNGNSSEMKKDRNDIREYMTLEEFLYYFEVGIEVECSYKGHRYSFLNYDTIITYEYNNDKSYQEFSSTEDMLDNFTLHTGEKLINIIPNMELESAAVTVTPDELQEWLNKRK